MADQSERDIHILHIDDDPEITSLTSAFLERENDCFRTSALTDPGEALDRLDSDSIDCVISDYEMPEMDGIELLRSVRDDFPDLPFILFTGKGSEEIASDAISAGVTDYLQKGTSSEQYQLLANRIENAVSQYRSTRRAEKQERILSLLQRLNQEMVTATKREDIETAVTDTLAEEDPYLLAWIGQHDNEWDRIVPITAAGQRADDLGPKRLTKHDEKAHGIIQDAIQSGEITVLRRADPSIELWPDDKALPYEGAVVVPVFYQDEGQGLLTVYSRDAGIFSAAELDMFEELAGDLGQALHTAETHRTLKRHHSALEAIPEGVIVLDENAEIVLANEPAAGLINQTPEEVQGLPFPTFVEEEIVDEDVIEWYVETLPQLLSSDSELEEAWYETTIYPVEGEPRTVEIHISLRPYDEEFRGTVGVLRDITDRKQRQQALDESRKRYRRLVDEAPVAIAMYQADGTLVYANEAAADLVNADDQSEILGRSALEFVHDRDRAFAEQRIKKVLEERVPTQETELTLVDADGNEKYVQLRGVPVSYDDEPAGQVVIKDITELKEREAELVRQRDRLDEFASFVSHDLRNPLEVMRGHLELAADETDNPHIETARAAQERMATLIETFLQLARKNESEIETESLDLQDIATEAWLHVSTDDVDLLIEGGQDIRGDQSLIKDLLENVFGNAIEHGGSIETVTVGPLPDEDGFYVADDGAGIPADQASQVFDYGYPTDSDGSGLGLAIVHRIAAVHGWDVSLTESASGGARFEFTNVDSSTRFQLRNNPER